MRDSTPTAPDARPSAGAGPDRAPQSSPPSSAQPPHRPSLLRRVGPGLLLAFVLALASYAISKALPFLSSSLIAILIGAILANVGATEGRLRPGLDVAAKPVLRLGIILLGFSLAIGDIIALGPLALVLIVVVVGVGLGSGMLIGRALRIPQAQTLLIACGFSICGAAAVAATEGVLVPERREGETDGIARERLGTQTATAIALVVVFGTLMIPLVPIAANLLGLSPDRAGVWAGASIHEVAQVAAAGTLIGHGALADAVLVKLGRVLMLAPVMAVIAAVVRRRAAAAGHDAAGADVKRPPLVPLWVLGFIAAVAVRSLGILPQPVIDAIAPIQGLCLAAAMFALGTGVRVALLRQVGGRPVLLALIITVIVTLIGLGGAMIAA